MGDRKNIGVLIGRSQTYFPREVIKGIRRAAKEEDINAYIFLGTQPSDFQREVSGSNREFAAFDYQANSIYEYAHLGGFDGTIINYGTVGYYLSNLTNVDDFTSAFTGDRPTIVLTDICSIPGVHSAISDNENGIRRLVDGLIEQGGYRKILFMRGPDQNTDSAERFAGYLGSMKSHGLPVSLDMTAVGDYSEFVDDQVNELLDRYPDAEAIVFSNDEMAFCGYRVCKKRGLKVGEDIVITGYDDCEQAKDMRPALTSVTQNGMAFGKHSIQQIVRMCEGQPCEPLKRIPTEVIWRESSGKNCEQLIDRTKMEPEDLDQKYVDLKRDYIRFQRYSWTMTLMSRGLSEYVEDEQVLYTKMLENLKALQVEDSYLFLLNKPIVNTDKTVITKPEHLCLAAACRQGVITAYERGERPKVTDEVTIADLTNDGRQHNYFVFLLFVGSRQYGIMICDSSSPDFSFLYAVSLQFSQVLQTMELQQIAQASMHSLVRDMESIKERNRVLDMLSEYDELTGLLNRRGFFEGFQRKNLQIEVPAHIAYCDLDHLKEINDTWGHLEGDYAIRAAAQILKSCLREEDLLARIHGDEYACLIFSHGAFSDADFRKRVKDACARYNASSDKPYYVELSVGTHQCSVGPYTDLRELAKLADATLYEDKKNRRTSVRKEGI